jgi:predicted ATPase/class 3 adenylate cyclase
MVASTLPTGTVTFLFTDIEGSTRLLQKFGSEYPGLLTAHAGLIREAVGASGGKEVSTEGDAFFVVFDSATSALAAAVAAQRSLAIHGWPPEGEVRVRMGLHTGDGTLGGDNYVGLDVHRAARVAATAHGGQLVLTAATVALVGRSLPPGVELRSLGKFRLKDLNEPEEIYQAVIDGLESSFPPLKTLDARPLAVPLILSSFVGRAAELDQAVELLKSTRILTLTGPGGAGKTRMAVQLATDMADEYQGGVFFASLEAVSEAENVPLAILDAMGATRSALAAEPRRHLLDLIAGRRLLIVLDNFEQVLAAAPLLPELLTAAPESRLLVTSRAPLRIAGEQELAIPPLALPAVNGRPTAASLQSFEAVELFVERAKAVKPDFMLTDGNAEAVATLTRRLDGLPLAIELAAARVKLLPPEAIVNRLEPRLLAGGGRDLPSRHQTLESTIAWSYDLLDDNARCLFDRLSVFIGGGELDQIEAVCGPGLPGDLLDGLAGLVDQSLVGRSEDNDEPRFRMLEVIRSFAAERLRVRPEAGEIADRHAQAYLELSQLAEPFLLTKDRNQWIERLTIEHANIHAALRRALESGDASTAQCLVGSVWRYWQVKGLLSEAEEHVTDALALGGADPQARLSALAAAGGVSYWRGNVEKTSEYYLAALDLAEREGNKRELAEANYNASFVFDPDQVEKSLEQSLARLEVARALYEEMGDRTGLGKVYWSMANSYGASDQFEKTIEYSEKALEMFGDDRPFDRGWAYFTVSWACINLGREAEAVDSLAKAMSLLLSIRDLSALGLMLGAGVTVAHKLGQTERAAHMLGGLRGLLRQSGADIAVTQRTFDWSIRDDGPVMAAFPDAVKAGESMSIDETVAGAISFMQEVKSSLAGA